jgi:hypothetical protein
MQGRTELMMLGDPVEDDKRTVRLAPAINLKTFYRNHTTPAAQG